MLLLQLVLKFLAKDMLQYLDTLANDIYVCNTIKVIIIHVEPCPEPVFIKPLAKRLVLKLSIF
jgi:hypothetical protein